MYKQGIVCDVNEKYATIYFLRDSACGGECASCKGCEAQEMTVQVLNTQGASIGDRVEVISDEKQMMKISTLMYLIPFSAFLLGMALGYYIIGSFFEKPYTEIFSIIIGILFIILSRIILRTMDDKWGKNIQHALSIQIIQRREEM